MFEMHSGHTLAGALRKGSATREVTAWRVFVKVSMYTRFRKANNRVERRPKAITVVECGRGELVSPFRARRAINVVLD